MQEVFCKTRMKENEKSTYTIKTMLKCEVFTV